MRKTDFTATIREYVEDTRPGDVVTAEAEDSSVWEQDVCEVHDVNGGKIVCVTVGGSIPMMILETVTDDTYVQAYTYKDGNYEHLGRLRKYGREGHAKHDEYDAEGWLNTNEFLSSIK